MEQGLYAPIYATALTRGLLEVKLREHKLLDDAEIHTVTESSLVDLDPFTVEFFHTCHSFPDSVGVSVLTPCRPHRPHQRLPFRSDAGRRQTHRGGQAASLGRRGRAAARGGQHQRRTGRPDQERAHRRDDARQRRSARPRAAFCSQRSPATWAVCSRSSTSPVGTTGASASSAAPWSTTSRSPSSSAIWTSARTNCYSTGEMESLPPSKVVVVATGSQGEPTSAMVRMSLGEHRQITLRKGDTVILSAMPIPGQRGAVQPHG